MNVEQWIAFGGLIMSIVGWLLLVERRLTERMTYRDHKQICDDKHEEIKEMISRLEQTIRDDRTEANKHREGVRDSLEEIRTNIAVMQSQGLFDDAGRLRR